MTSHKRRKTSGVVALLALAAILYFRLTPFDFAWEGSAALDRFSWGPLSLRDVPLNVVLFVPLGFGLGGVLAKGGRGEREKGGKGALPFSPSPFPPFSLVLLICLTLSAALEAVQLLLPDHVPSTADVIANGMGAIVGYGLYRAWEMGFGVAVHRYVTGRNLLIGLGLYVLGVALLTGYLYRSVRLSNWDTSFPLVVGNEAVGRREWSGHVGHAIFTVHEDSSPVFVAAYAFGGLAPFEDATDGGAPPLDWAEGPTTAQSGDGVTVGPGEWLTTGDPFTGFNEDAQRYNHFTIEMAVTSADPTQRGPARIISVSADAEQRNVTIGQEGDALIIRLRTPAGGENGQKPELLVPGVFADERQRLIYVRYKAPLMHVMIDVTDNYVLSLAPGAAFFSGFITENRWQIDMTGNPYRYNFAYWRLVYGLGTFVFGGLALAKKKLATENTD